MNDRSILQKIKKGQREGLEKAIEYYTPYVTVIVYGIIGPTMRREDMEEVVSDVFMTLWDHVKQIDEEQGGLRQYLGAIARNRAENKLRLLEPGGDKEELKMNWDIAAGLGQVDSEILFRYYRYEEGIRKISKRTGLTITDVKNKLVSDIGYSQYYNSDLPEALNIEKDRIKQIVTSCLSGERG